MADYRLPMDADGVKYHGTVDQNEENPGHFMYGLDENGNKRIIRTDEQGNVLTKVTGSNVLLLKSEEDNNLFNILSNRGFVYLGENISVSTAGIQPFSLKNSENRSILIKNNTDVEIKISVWHIFSDSKHLGVSPTNIRVASGATAFVSSEEEVLSYPAIRAAMTIEGRPTEGSLSIYVFGR